MDKISELMPKIVKIESLKDVVFSCSTDGEFLIAYTFGKKRKAESCTLEEADDFLEDFYRRFSGIKRVFAQDLDLKPLKGKKETPIYVEDPAGVVVPVVDIFLDQEELRLRVLENFGEADKKDDHAPWEAYVNNLAQDIQLWKKRFDALARRMFSEEENELKQVDQWIAEDESNEQKEG